jgi:hypothetical protein
MEEPKSTAGQGLGIAGLVLGILAIPLGIIPCTFYMGIVFGLIGLILSLVALSQANRGYGPKGLIIAALICSAIGFSFASAWGFAISHTSGRVIKDFVRGFKEGSDYDNNAILLDMEDDTSQVTEHASGDMQKMTDTLKALENDTIMHKK